MAIVGFFLSYIAIYTYALNSLLGDEVDLQTTPRPQQNLLPTLDNAD
ncbi:hypothetical protein ACQ4M4_18615 [Leptolyngbya sp. AN02str]